VRAYGLLAAVHLRRGETAAARAAAASGASLIAGFKSATSFYLLEGYAGVAEVYLHQWEAGDRSSATRQAAQQACSALRRYAHIFPVGEPRARLLSGRLLYLSGRPRRARATWRASLSAAERLGMPFEAALAHSALGLHAAGEAQRRQHMESAQTLLRELGLPHEPTRGPDLAPE
jgi:eukaryotic-like serine/threonine-protein kinase